MVTKSMPKMARVCRPIQTSGLANVFGIDAETRSVAAIPQIANGKKRHDHIAEPTIMTRGIGCEPITTTPSRTEEKSIANNIFDVWLAI